MKIRLGADKRIEILVIIELILAFLINFCTVILNNKTLVSIFFNLSFVIFFMLFLDFTIKVGKVSIWSIGLIVSSVLSVILSYSFNNYISFDGTEYIKCLIFFIITNTFYYILSKIKITKKLYNFSVNIPFLIVLTDIFSYYLLKNRVTMAHAITLNFSNPNQAGLWLSVAFMFGILKYTEESSKTKKLMFLGLTMMVFPLMLKTLSRNALISVVFLVIMMIYGNIFKKRKLSKEIIILVIIFPLIFCFAYLILINTSFVDNFSFLISEGKSLTSRLSIWNLGVKTFLEHPIIGNYSRSVSYGQGVAQFHNVGIDVVAKYGIVVYFTFIKLTYDIIESMNKKIFRKIQYLSMCCFLSVIIQGVFEAGIYSGYCGLDYLIGGFIIIGRGVTNKYNRDNYKQKIY